MTIKNRKRCPILPQDVAEKFPAGTTLRPIDREGSVYLIGGSDSSGRQLVEAWWVDYAGSDSPFAYFPETKDRETIRLYAN